MVRMRAPHGVRHVSHDGVQHKVDERGFVDVEPHAVDALRPHGFVVQSDPPSPSESVPMTRGDILAMLSHLGVDLSDVGLDGEKLVEALMAACKARAGAVVAKVDAVVDGDPEPAVEADKPAESAPRNEPRPGKYRGAR